MIQLKKTTPTMVLAVLVFAAALVTFVLLSACASTSVPRWTSEDARALEPAPPSPSAAGPTAMAFPVEQPAQAPDDAQFSDDFVPERDVAAAELAKRIDVTVAALAALARARRAEVGTVNATETSSIGVVQQQLADARLAEEQLRGASLSQWQRKRALAAAAVGVLERSVAARVARQGG